MPVVVDTTAKRVLDVARGELGAHENPFGSNKTPYGAWYGMNGVAWCNIWVTWVLHHAGVEEIPKFAYTPSSAQWFRDNGAWIPKNNRPEPGDLIWFDFPRDGVNRISHIGFVEGVLADGRIATIEGNTNEAGGRTGGRVMRHNRSVSGGIVGFGRITYQDAIEEAQDMPWILHRVANGETFIVIGQIRHPITPGPGVALWRQAGAQTVKVNEDMWKNDIIETTADSMDGLRRYPPSEEEGFFKRLAKAVATELK